MVLKCRTVLSGLVFLGQVTTAPHTWAVISHLVITGSKLHGARQPESGGAGHGAQPGQEDGGPGGRRRAGGGVWGGGRGRWLLGSTARGGWGAGVGQPDGGAGALVLRLGLHDYTGGAGGV